MRALVIYATDEGQTGKIALRIADGLADRNIPVDRHNIADDSVAPVALDTYDAVVVGSPMHYSHYDPQLAEQLKHYRTVLNEIPSAFFSVSLGILSDKESERSEIEKIADAYLRDTGWQPALKRHFAGALAYSKYSWFKRHMMHWIARKGGARTDMHFDYEFTDWPQVDNFIDEFAEFVESCKQPDEAHTQRSVYAEPTRQYSVKHRQTSRS